MSVTCPYCQEQAQLVKGDRIYPHLPELHELNFWHCEPCKAYVGCHKAGATFKEHGRTIVMRGDEPLGRLADARLRAAKARAHAAFDPLWKNRLMKRTVAYAWLANTLKIPVKDCHIGMFDVEQCEAVVRAVDRRTGKA